MAKTTIAATVGPAPYASTGVSISAAEAAADVANGNQTPLNGRVLLIAHNTDAGAPHNVTVNSVADSFNRLGDITNDAVAASAFKVYGPFPAAGWKQTADGMLYFSADNALIKFTVLLLDARA